ncbi:MAG: hypothetical protein KKH98_01865 [Spirochaetes bacterium]|nr:hypothetical protein [Spirochaetota bacterium]
MTDRQNEQDIESYYLLKGRFKGADSNTFGLFIMYLSINIKAVDNVLVAASHFSSLYDTSPTIPWDAFEEKITQLKWKGEISVNTSHDLQLLLTNSIKQDMAEEIIDAIGKQQNNKIDHTLSNILIKGLIDKNVKLEFSAEKVTQRDMIQVKDERARREKDEKEAKEREAVRKAETQKYKVEDGAVTLPVNLVLAPVSGIPIYDIKAGDLIMVKIDGATERGNYFIDLLNARTPEGEVTAVKGSVKEISMNALGEFELLVEIGPGIYGKSLESEQVKIKKYDIREEKIKLQSTSVQNPQMSAMANNNQTIINPKASGGNKDYFIWVVGGITFLLAILIMYLLFSGLL